MVSNFIYTTAIDKIRKMKSRIKIIPGGSSAGKTYAILPILIDKCCREKNLSVSVVSESVPHLKRGAMRDFLNIMKMTNRYVDEHWNRTNSIYTFSNGSYIEFFPADSADKLRGSRRQILFVNECNNITEEAYTQLAMRTSGEIFLDYNPSHRFWIEDVLKDTEAESITLTYKDNEAVPENVIKFFEARLELAKTSEYWENWCKVYVYGKEGRLDGTVFDNWKVIEKIPEEARLIGHGLDFGYSNDPSSLIAVYKYNDEIILDEIIYQSGLLNSDIAKIMKQEGVDGEVYCDSAEPKSIAELKRYGLRVFPTKKGKDSILYGIGLMQENTILVTRRSTNLINELTNYIWKKDREGNSTNVPIDAFNHAIDATRYLFMMKFGKRNDNAIPFVIGGR